MTINQFSLLISKIRTKISTSSLSNHRTSSGWNYLSVSLQPNLSTQPNHFEISFITDDMYDWLINTKNNRINLIRDTFISPRLDNILISIDFHETIPQNRFYDFWNLWSNIPPEMQSMFSLCHPPQKNGIRIIPKKTLKASEINGNNPICNLDVSDCKENDLDKIAGLLVDELIRIYKILYP